MLFHIGYKKCGSTWLQRNLFNRTDRGFFPICPEMKKENAQRAKYLGAYFVFDSKGYLLDPFSNRTPEIRLLYDELSKGAGNKVPVTSYERLCGQAHAGGFDAAIVAERIADVFPDAKILIVIREQIKVAVSLYFQYLRAGGHRHYRNYFLPPSDAVRPGFAPSYYEYDKLIAHYQSLFGKNNVLCLPLELMLTEPATFIDHLRQFTGAHIPSDLPFDRREKAGLPRAIEIKTRYLNLFKHSHSLNGYAFVASQSSEKAIVYVRRLMSRLVPASYETKLVQRIHSDIAAMFDSYYCESNRKTEALTGLSLKERFGYM